MRQAEDSTGRRSHAVVLGASMAGLLAARVLTERFNRVTVIERDALPDAVSHRKGVPQGRHAHGFLPSGMAIVEQLFPGAHGALLRRGGIDADLTGDFLWFQHGEYKRSDRSGFRGIVCTRPCLEAEVRSRVVAVPNLELRTGCDILEPLYDSASRRVVAARFLDRASRGEAVLPADLIVDATGRGSRTPKWLEAWGFERPVESRVEINLGYATREFARKTSDLKGRVAAIVASTPPSGTRCAAMLAGEGNRWIVTLAGVLGDHPTADDAEWLAFAESLPTPDIYDVVSRAEPLSDILTFKYPAETRRHYEKLEAFPAGYIVLGDALCNFNPIYGQGMSVAAQEAMALRKVLSSDEDLAERFFRKAGKIIDAPWLVAVGEDLRYSEIAGPRPAGFGLVRAYLDRVHRAAARNRVVNQRFFEVAGLLRSPSSLFAPSILARVLVQGGRRPSVKPSNSARALRRVPSPVETTRALV